MKWILAVLVLTLQMVGAREFRELTNLEGKKIKAELLELKDGELKVRANQRVFKIAVDKLSQADRDFLVEWEAEQQGDSAGGDGVYKELIFEDDFSGDGFGERWKHYKSASEVKDGVFYGITAPDSDHQAVDTVKMEGRKDVEVAVKFRFSGPEAKRFNLKFDDNQYKGSHAGHICRVVISPTQVRLSDGKTGNFKNEIFDKKKAGGQLDEATKELLESKQSNAKVDLKQDKWYSLLIQTKDDLMTVLIDGKKVVELKSEGIAHETKSSVGMATPGNGVAFDDFVIKAAAAAKSAK